MEKRVRRIKKAAEAEVEAADEVADEVEVDLVIEVADDEAGMVLVTEVVEVEAEVDVEVEPAVAELLRAAPRALGARGQPARPCIMSDPAAANLSINRRDRSFRFIDRERILCGTPYV